MPASFSGCRKPVWQAIHAALRKTGEQDAVSGNALAALVGDQFLDQCLRRGRRSSARLSSSARRCRTKRARRSRLIVTGIVGAFREHESDAVPGRQIQLRDDGDEIVAVAPRPIHPDDKAVAGESGSEVMQ